MYPANTIKAVIGGSLPSGEEFAWGFQLKANGTPGQTDLVEIAGSISAAVANDLLTATVKGYYNNNVVFETVTVYLYEGGTQATAIAEAAIPNGAGTSVNSPAPNQCAIVVTLQTGVPGRSNRGRSYLPCVAVNQIGADTQLSATVCSTIADAFAAMLTAINATVGFSVTAVVASSTHSASRPISAVTVDSKVDTQRRRARQEVALRSHTSTV